MNNIISVIKRYRILVGFSIVVKQLKIATVKRNRTFMLIDTASPRALDLIATMNLVNPITQPLEHCYFINSMYGFIE